MEKAGKYIRSSIWQNVYIICLITIAVIHWIFVTLLDFLKEENTDKVSTSEYITIISLLILEWFLICLQCKILHKYIFLTDIKPIFCLYLSKILACADIYLLIFKTSPAQFDHPNDVLIQSANYRNIAMILLNYSASIQTLTGISAVAPRKIVSEFFSAAQVIFFGIGYSVFILSIAVLRFAQADITSKTAVSSPRNIFDFPNETETVIPKAINSNPLLSAQDNFKQNAINSSTFSSLSQVLNSPKLKFIKNYLKYAKLFYRFMMLILICIQTPRLILMYFMCDLHCKDNVVLIVGIMLDSILLFLCIVCGVIRMRLIKRLGIHVNISIFGLIRSYLTVLIQFGILYFDVWIVTKNNKTPAFDIHVVSGDQNNYFSMLAHFVYFSMSTFTNVGAEAAIATHEWTGQVLNCMQMLLGVIFHTTVFGVSLLDIQSKRIIDTQRFVESHTLTPTRDIKRTNTLRHVGLIQREIKEMVIAHTPKNDKHGYEFPAINSLSINRDITDLASE